MFSFMSKWQCSLSPLTWTMQDLRQALLWWPPSIRPQSQPETIKKWRIKVQQCSADKNSSNFSLLVIVLCSHRPQRDKHFSNEAPKCCKTDELKITRQKNSNKPQEGRKVFSLRTAREESEWQQECDRKEDEFLLEGCPLNLIYVSSFTQRKVFFINVKAAKKTCYWSKMKPVLETWRSFTLFQYLWDRRASRVL